MRIVYFFLISGFLFLSCKNDSPAVSDNVSKLKAEINKSPSDELYQQLNEAYRELITGKKLAASEKESVIEGAMNYFNNAGKIDMGAVYLTELLKDYPGSKANERIKSLIEYFDKKGSKDVSNLIKRMYSVKFNDNKTYSSDIGGIDPDFDIFIKNVGETIFADLEKTGKLNVKAAKDYVNNCEAFALVNPEDKRAPEYIFKAAEVAHTIKSYNKTFELYDWLLEKYPNYEKAPTALFLKGYVFDNELKDSTKAIKLYNEFLQKYPNSDLVDDVKTLIEFMGKSDEEILKLIEASKKKG